eukprot:5518133-Amphidinium_carterae.1
MIRDGATIYLVQIPPAAAHPAAAHPAAAPAHPAADRSKADTYNGKMANLLLETPLVVVVWS